MNWSYRLEVILDSMLMIFQGNLMVSDCDLVSCGGRLPVLSIWTLSTSGPSGDGSSWQVNKPASQGLLPCCLLSTESIPQGEHPQDTDDSKHPHLQREARFYRWGLGTWMLGPAQMLIGRLCGIHTIFQRARSFCWDVYSMDSPYWGRLRNLEILN